MAKWTIERIELLYFDLEHLRWRLFQEDFRAYEGANLNNQEGGFHYRHHIQCLLDSMRDALHKTTKGSEITIDAPRNSEGKTEGATASQNKKQGAITFSKETVKKLFEAFRAVKVDEPEQVLKSILNYYRYEIEKEQFSDKEKEEIKKFLKEFEDKFIENIDSIKEIKIPDVKHTVALDVISVLPILRNWEIWGALDEGWKNNKSSTLLHQAGRIREPMYATCLSYKKDHPNQEAPSTQLLGYEIRLGVIYRDMVNPSSPTQFVAEDDYYVYCHNTNAESNRKEKALYLTYGAFLDELQKLLDYKSKKVDTNQDINSECIYYIACPIMTALGRRHFIHFYLRPDENNKTPTLEDLWCTWLRYQKLIDWENIRLLLISEMEHIGLAYFQTFLSDAIKEKQNGNASLSLCEKGHLIFPMEKMKLGKNIYKYKAYRVPYEEIDASHEREYDEDGLVVFDCGYEWQGEENDSDDDTSWPISINCEIEKERLFCCPEKDSTNKVVIDTISQRRKKNVLKQQYDFAKRLHAAKKYQQNELKAEKDKREAIENIMAAFSHQLGGTLRAFEFNVEHGNDVLINRNTVAKLDGFFQQTYLMSADTECLKQTLCKERSGDSSPLQVLREILIDVLHQLLSPNGLDKTHQHYLAYALRQEIVPQGTKISVWKKDHVERERSLRENWEKEWWELYKSGASLEQLQKWIGEHFAPLCVEGFDSTVRFKSDGTIASLLRIVLPELVFNAFKYYNDDDGEERTPIRIEWISESDVYRIWTSNPSANEEYTLHKGSYKGHEILTTLANKASGRFERPTPQNHFTAEFCFPHG